MDDRGPGTSNVQLKHRSRAMRVRPGEYVIGRRRSCHLVIDDDLVSRTHARLHLQNSDRLLIADLGSRNGVFINGKRIGTDARVLHNHDIFTIGPEELHVLIDGSEHSNADELPFDVLEESSRLLLKRAETLVPERTEVSDDLDLIGSVAERALRAGNPRDAEKILEMHLRATLVDAQGRMRASTRVRQKAFEFGLRLAKATGKGEWFDYAVDLLCAERTACTAEQFLQLQRVAAEVPCVDVRRLRRYMSILRTDSRTMAGIKIASLIDELAGQLERT